MPAWDGTLRKDPADKILYLGVPDVTAALAQVTAAGWHRRHAAVRGEGRGG